MTEPVIYRDHLIRITTSGITFFRYSFPFLRSKEINFSEINNIDIRNPAMTTGKWRLWGTGNFSTWFPLDFHRPRRTRIFICTVHSQRMKIGFTVEDPMVVTRILRDKGLLLKGDIPL